MIMTISRMQAISGNAFREACETRIFPSYANKTGGQHDGVLTYLKDVGFRNVSHKLTVDLGADDIAFFQTLKANGIMSSVSVGEPRVKMTSTEWNRISSLLRGPLAGCIKVVSSWNEPNHRRSASDPPLDNWDVDLVDEHGILFDRIQNEVNGSLIGQGYPVIKVGTPPLWSGDIDVELADLAKIAPGIRGKANKINWHLYPRGGDPSFEVAHHVQVYRDAYGNLQIYASEGGYSDAENSTSGQPVTDGSISVYMIKMWLEYALLGGIWGQFEFLDDPNAALDNRESNLGLIETPGIDWSTWSIKPQGLAIKDTFSLIKPGGTNALIPCEVSAPADVIKLLVNHGGGNTLFLWRRVNIEKNLQPIAISPEYVTVKTLTGTKHLAVEGKVVKVNFN